MEYKTHQFGEVIDENTNILILGSFPSVQSLKENFYYMNPNNRFYKVLSSIYKVDFYHASIEEKIKLLHFYHIGLFDVIASCHIHQSSDSSIQNVEVNDIPLLVKKYPIHTIICNGKKSYELFSAYFPSLKFMCICCPSTSSANAATSLNTLIRQYQTALTKGD